MAEQTNQLDRLRRENTELAESLMDMVQMFFKEDRHGLLRPRFGSAEEAQAMRLLVSTGFAKKKSDGYELLWGKLTERWLGINGKLPSSNGSAAKDVCDEIDTVHWNLEKFNV